MKLLGQSLSGLQSGNVSQAHPPVHLGTPEGLDAITNKSLLDAAVAHFFFHCVGPLKHCSLLGAQLEEENRPGKKKLHYVRPLATAGIVSVCNMLGRFPVHLL